EPFVYELVCGLVPPPAGPFGLDPDVKEERVWLEEQVGRRLLMAERERASAMVRNAEGAKEHFCAQLGGGESFLAQLGGPHRYPVLSGVRSELSRWRFYHQFRTDSQAPARAPQVGVRTPALAHDGSDLAAALMTIVDIGDGGALRAAVARAFDG